MRSCCRPAGGSEGSNRGRGRHRGRGMAGHRNRSKGTCCFFPLNGCQSPVLTDLRQPARGGPGIVTASVGRKVFGDKRCQLLSQQPDGPDRVLPPPITSAGTAVVRPPPDEAAARTGTGPQVLLAASSVSSVRIPAPFRYMNRRRNSGTFCGSTTRSSWTRCLSSCACSYT